MNLNVPANNMKGFLMLFEDPTVAFQWNTKAFYNPKIQKVKVMIKGVHNKLYLQGLCAHQQWDEAKKLFTAGSKQHPDGCERPRPGRCVSTGVPNHQVCPVA